MSLVNLVSGGLDSTLVGVLAKEEHIKTYPLFIDYGQRARNQEWESCQHVHARMGLTAPVRMDLSGFGQVILSGLTSERLDVKSDAFTPGRNLMFLLMGCAYAYQVRATSVAIGLLAERFSLFPDQSSWFIQQTERAIALALGKSIKVLTPLNEFTKADVIALARTKGIADTYSCHAGGKNPCGRCISCLEFEPARGG